MLSDQINQKIDVIIGGPPCQTFSSLGKGKISSLGKKIEKDPRNFLYTDFIRFVKFFSPKCFVMENVPGFQRQMNGKVFKQFLDLFEDKDYKINFKILNSKNFGVPQNRERLFIVGIKNQIFKFPDETHFDNRNNLFKCIDNNYVNVNDALNDLPVIEDDWRLSKCHIES